MPLIVSGLEEVIIATATVQQQEGTSNRYIDLMIDSGAAAHVCPPWFATESQIQPLTPENGPQLRTVTNQPIKLHGYKWVRMNYINEQRIVIPFYVCDIKQPILSVTRLIEQGFQIVLDDNPRIHHDKGFDSSITRSHGLFFLQAEITTLPRGTELKVDNTEQTDTSRSTVHRICRRLLAIQQPRRARQSTSAIQEDNVYTNTNTVPGFDR